MAPHILTKTTAHQYPKIVGLISISLYLLNYLTVDYTVKWQVVNTGDEAREDNGLRGGFETHVNSTKRHEGTKYQGTHYVQAFLLKRGKCIAMSKEFIVNIQ